MPTAGPLLGLTLPSADAGATGITPLPPPAPLTADGDAGTGPGCEAEGGTTAVSDPGGTTGGPVNGTGGGCPNNAENIAAESA